MKYKKKTPRNLEKEFGLKVRFARLKLGLTQEQLSKKTSLGRVSITNIELGKQRVMLCHALVLKEVLGIEL